MDPTTKYAPRRYEFGTSFPPPAPGELQVVYETAPAGTVPVMLDFLCPCGCGHTCPIHLKHPNYAEVPGFPRWDYDPVAVRVTPSIRWLSGCKAHFNINDGGTVVIHPDSGT